MGKIYIGTSGWSYPTGEGTWKGNFYPSGTKYELEYYSRFFKTVEVNSSFYRPPNPGYVANWVKLTPADFLFTVKLWQKFTHPNMYQKATGEVAVISGDDIDMFQHSIEPLARAGKLGVLLAQFPPSFKNNGFGQQILEAIARHFGQYRLAFELRHRSWSDDPATEFFLKENHIAWVQIDEPKFQSSVACDTPHTCDIAYFRFHGLTGGHRYNYTDEELGRWAETIQTAKAEECYVYFNNDYQAYAVANCQKLAGLLKP